MKVLLNIAGETFLLKSDNGLTTLMRALQGAKRVVHDNTENYIPANERHIFLYSDDEVSVSTKMIASNTKITIYRPDEPLGLPEHGTRQD